MNNFTHPEIEAGEVFLTNLNTLGFNQLTWNTKRRGVVALDGKGRMTNNDDWFPVFISKKELEASHQRIEDIRKKLRENIKY